MNVTGSIIEWYSVLNAAVKIKAQAIHFITPNIIFMENGEDYVFTKTTIAITEAASVPRATYRNMLLYLQKARREQHKPMTPFYGKQLESVTFTSSKIIFDHSENLTLKVILPVFKINETTEYDIKETIQPSIHPRTPYLVLTHTQMNYLHSILYKDKQKYRDKLRNTADNAIRIENEQVILYMMVDGKLVRTETYLTNVNENKRFENQWYPFSDQAFHLYRWMSKVTAAKKIRVIPRDTHSIIEGMDGDMLLKVRSAHNNVLDVVKV